MLFAPNTNFAWSSTNNYFAKKIKLKCCKWTLDEYDNGTELQVKPGIQTIQSKLLTDNKYFSAH